MRDVIFSNDKTTTGLFVETMNDSRAFFPANSRQHSAMVEQCVDQSVFAMSRTRVNDQLRRLVDHDEVVVFEQNFKRDRLRQGLDFFQRRLGEINLIAPSNNLAWSSS